MLVLVNDFVRRLHFWNLTDALKVTWIAHHENLPFSSHGMTILLKSSKWNFTENVLHTTLYLHLSTKITAECHISD